MCTSVLFVHALLTDLRNIDDKNVMMDPLKPWCWRFEHISTLWLFRQNQRSVSVVIVRIRFVIHAFFKLENSDIHGITYIHWIHRLKIHLTFLKLCLASGGWMYIINIFSLFHRNKIRMGESIITWLLISIVSFFNLLFLSPVWSGGLQCGVFSILEKGEGVELELQRTTSSSVLKTSSVVRCPFCVSTIVCIFTSCITIKELTV